MCSLSLIMQVTFWYWLALGGTLVIFDVLFFSGEFLLWIGIGALGTGGITYIYPAALPFYQVFIFGCLSLSGIFIGRRWVKLRGRGISGQDVTVSHLIPRGDALLGKTFTLDKSIVHGKGWLRIGDVYWLAVGPDISAGKEVRVLSVEGNILRIEEKKGIVRED